MIMNSGYVIIWKDEVVVHIKDIIKEIDLLKKSMTCNSTSYIPNSSYPSINLPGNIGIFYPEERCSSTFLRSVGWAYLSATFGGVTSQLTAHLTRYYGPKYSLSLGFDVIQKLVPASS
jgi:hypothetical protein